MISCDTLTVLERFIYASGPIVTIVGLMIAFSKWKQSRRQNREELLRNLLDDFNRDDLIQKAISDDFILETWEDLGVESEHRRKAVEQTLGRISYLCYLRKTKLIDTDEFVLFQETLDRFLSIPCIVKFLDEEDKRVGEKNIKGRYYYIFDYRQKRDKLDIPFKSGGSSLRIDSRMNDNSVKQENFAEPTMVIKISRAYKDGMNPDEILEVTRKWWRINPKTANKTTLVLAVANGIVKGAFRRNGMWQKDTTGEHDGRYCFDGRIAEDSGSRWFLNKPIAGLFPKGASNPIRYFAIPEDPSKNGINKT